MKMPKKTLPPVGKNKEEVLTIVRKILYPNGAHYGLRRLKQEALKKVLETISEHAQFLPRYLVEEDPEIKQIIPYLVFRYRQKVFLMQRLSSHTDRRLADQFSLGVGGHIRKEEFSGKDIFAWARREFEEEVSCHGDFTIAPMGLLNDDTAPVHAVHAGLVLQLVGASPNIKVKGEHKSGWLATLKECEKFYDRMENWSQIVFESLKGE